ncbi:MAG TPA: hypothetical protein VM076_18630 [Gemmatimonadaceae bacterium]|nr:hypothetical protein [Gemmatimonadaceae bacterium]
MSDPEAFEEFAHDLRGTMGSLRLVMSSLIDEEDAEQRGAFLALAEEEVQRVAVCAGALPALAAVDRSASAEIDLGPALADAALAALRYGVRATVAPAASARVLSQPVALASVLPALFQLAAGTTGATTVSCEPSPGGVRIECTTATMWPQARHLVARLVAVAGGRLVDIDSVCFVLPVVP